MTHGIYGILPAKNGLEMKKGTSQSIKFVWQHLLDGITLG